MRLLSGVVDTADLSAFVDEGDEHRLENEIGDLESPMNLVPFEVLPDTSLLDGTPSGTKNNDQPLKPIMDNHGKKENFDERKHNTDIFKPEGSKNKAFLIELLNFELNLSFIEPERRRLLRVGRNTRSKLRGILVKETLSGYLNDFYEEKLAERRRERGMPYANLDEVYLNSGAERVVEAKSSSGELYDRSYSAAYAGVAIFRQEHEDQMVPNQYIVQSIQLDALMDESNVLLRALKDADIAGGAATSTAATNLAALESISANVFHIPDSHNNNSSKALHTHSNHLDTVIVVAAAIAGMSMVLLATSLLFAYRRQQHESRYATGPEASTRTPKHDNIKSPRRRFSLRSSPVVRRKQQPETTSLRVSTSEEIPPSTLAASSSSSPTEQGNAHSSEFGVSTGVDEMSTFNSPSHIEESYPDGQSDVSSLGNVIFNAIQAYENNIDSPDTEDSFIRRITRSGMTSPDSQESFAYRMDNVEEESVGASSLGETTLGFSFSGQTFTDPDHAFDGA